MLRTTMTFLVLGLALMLLPGMLLEPLRPGPVPAGEEVAVDGPYTRHPDWGHHLNLADFRERGGALPPYQESPLLARRVEAGELPPVAERLPANPLVMIPWEKPGRYGGKLRYTEYTTRYCHYLRHLNKTPLLEPVTERGACSPFCWIANRPEPGIIESWSVNDDATAFTFTIRRGLKWSDGTPVTTENVDFFFNSVMFNKDVTPALPEHWRWGGEPVELDVMGPREFRLVFAKSFGAFLERMTNMSWAHMMLPSHYLKRFHRDFTSMDELGPIMDEHGYTPSEWGRFFLSIGGRGLSAGEFVPERMPRDHAYPTLGPWNHARQPNPGDYVLERNPYYYKVDPEGRQLPYIDRLHRSYVSNIQIQNLKIMASETDLQFQFIRLSDYPMFKRSELRGGLRALLLPAWQDHMLIYPMNLQPADPNILPILGDARFRRALSLALNRDEIREVLFLGKGIPSQYAPIPGSPWHMPEFNRAFADYDPEAAARLLDEMGLPWDEKREYRLTPDGKPFTLRIDFYDVSPTSAPGAELAREYWSDIGIRTRAEQMDGGRFWNMRGANEIQVTVWWGDGAHPAAHSFISGFLMTRPWDLWDKSDGLSGEAPQPWAQEMLRLRERCFGAPGREDRRQAGIDVFRIFTEQLHSIGTLYDVPVPFVFSRRLRNVASGQARGIYAVGVAEGAEQWFFGEDDA